MSDPTPGDILGAANYREEQNGEHVDVASIRAVADDDWTETNNLIRLEMWMRSDDGELERKVVLRQPSGVRWRNPATGEWWPMFVVTDGIALFGLKPERD